MKDETYTIDLIEYKVYNVEPCPKCGNKTVATTSVWRYIHACCGECDFRAHSSFLMHGSIPISNVKDHSQFTRKLLQTWNDSVALEKNTEVKKIRTRIAKKEVNPV